jgi:hypothetical protein
MQRLVKQFQEWRELIIWWFILDKHKGGFMKISNRRLIALVNTIGAIQDKDFDIKTSFALSRILNTAANAVQPYENELKKLNGKTMDVEEFNKNVNELLDIEIDIDINKISQEDIINSGNKMTIAQVNGLEPIIE